MQQTTENHPIKPEQKFNNWENSPRGAKMKRESNPFIIVGQILIIIASIFWCFTIIGLIWGIPMIMGCNKRLNQTKPITIGHIIITIFFYGILGSILTLVGAAQAGRF